MCLIAASSNYWFEPSFWLGLFMAVVALGVVIFVHELGHFLVAKMCGVKCMKFYVGFDPPLAIGFGKHKLRLPSALWKKQWGETEYGIGVIPLGGYVRMLGQDDNPTSDDESPIETTTGPDGSTKPKLDPRNYQAKNVPQRMAIISAGVVMNIIFAFIFALAAVYIGVKYTPCIVARTQPGDPAWRQGVLPGDVIVEINGVKNPRFSDLQQQVLLSNAADGLKVVIQRPGQKALIHLTLKPDKDYVSPKDLPRLGVAMEMALELRDPQPTIPNTAAGELPKDAGFRSGDKIVAIGGRAVPNSIVFEEILVRSPDKPLEFTVERMPSGKQPSADATAPKPELVKIIVPPNPWRELGLTMTMGAINAIREDSPATRAQSKEVKGGIQKGDKIVAIDGKPAGDPMTLAMRLRPLDGKEVRLTVERQKAGAAKDAAPELVEFTTTLDTPTWSAEGAYPDSPVALLSLGVTYHVVARVAAPPTGPAADKGIAVGDEVVQVELIPQKSPQTEEEKAEAEGARQMRPIVMAADKPSWPMVMSLAQGTSSKTGIRLTLKNEKETRKVDLVAGDSKEFFTPERGLLLQPNLVPLKVHSFGEAVDFAWRETKGSLMQVVLFLKKLTRGGVSPTAAGGPITIFRVAAMHANQGLGSLLLFLTLLSANLAVINFLPIPILDGGHMVFLTLEAIFRRPVSRRIVEPLTYAGALMILSLMIFTTVLDVQRLFNWL
ncbi:MAG: site-2 protease family protein [Planctomycetes bacterium]|nr:site-2 protease family protein [Planctomycetota bacterium]